MTKWKSPRSLIHCARGATLSPKPPTESKAVKDCGFVLLVGLPVSSPLPCLACLLDKVFTTTYCASSQTLIVMCCFSYFRWEALLFVHTFSHLPFSWCSWYSSFFSLEKNLFVDCFCFLLSRVFSFNTSHRGKLVIHHLILVLVAVFYIVKAPGFVLNIRHRVRTLYL